MRLDPDPKLTESNQNSKFWIGSGSDPTKNVAWIRGVAEKNPAGRFGLDWIKFGPAVEVLQVQQACAQTTLGISTWNLSEHDSMVACYSTSRDVEAEQILILSHHTRVVQSNKFLLNQ
jgi:hypothetical protein